MHQFTFTVPAESEGERLDRFLTVEIPNYSRSQIQRIIEGGHVVVPRVKVTKSNVALRAGDVITGTLPDPIAAKPEPEDLPVDVLYDDEDVIVINKSAGMVVHPGAGHLSGTLVNALLHHVKDLSGIGGEIRPGIVHRLDKGTSGVMIIAKNDAAHRELSRQFQDREIEKEYVALVWGLVQQRKRIDASIGRDPNNRQKMSTRAIRSREASTRVTWARDLKGITLLRVSILTGRTHQIRVHMSAIGHPVVGDALYGGVHRRVPGQFRALQRLQRPFLHAERLVFTHPRTGNRVEVLAPVPDELINVLRDVTPEELQGSLFEPLAEAEPEPQPVAEKLVQPAPRQARVRKTPVAKTPAPTKTPVAKTSATAARSRKTPAPKAKSPITKSTAPKSTAKAAKAAKTVKTAKAAAKPRARTAKSGA